MRRNEATRQILEDQIGEDPMEARIARIEADVAQINGSVAKLQDGMQAANDAIAEVKTGQAALKGEVSTLRAELKGDISRLELKIEASAHALETRLIKWIIATMIAVAGLAFTFAKFVN